MTKIDSKPKEPAIKGWFTQDDRPALLGTQCTACKSYFFPKEFLFCKNPACTSRDFKEIKLSSQGTIWSFTTNHYQPPAPYIPPTPFKPYTVVAVTLEKEQMVVLGQLADGYNPGDLHAGMEVELTLEPLYEQDGTEFITWKWKPTEAPL